MKFFASPWWFLLAIVLPIVGWLAATSYQAAAWDQLRNETVIPVGPKIDAANHPVAVLTDVRQPERNVACRAVGPKKQRTDIPASTVDVMVSSGGTEWHLIAFAEQGRDGVNIRCRPEDKQTDAAGYGYVVLDGFDDRAGVAKVIMGASFLAGAAIAALSWIARRSRDIN